MFGFGKKEEKKQSTCGCGGNCAPELMEKVKIGNAADRIKVLGGGCAKCHELQKHTEEALKELGISISVDLITDFSVIAAYGVMSTPALVINEKVVSCGKVLKKDEIEKLLKDGCGR